MDSLILYGPGGASPVQIGTWLRQDQGADYGSHDLVKAIEAESFSDGGAFVYERAGIRRMHFPLIVGSGAGLSLSLVQIESLLRLNARPGGYLDVQPEGVASSEAVRFDLVHGRWEPDYSIYHQRLPRRAGFLHLDTQPYGYWPTQIILASTASVGLPNMVLPLAAIVGDVPAQTVLTVMPTVGSYNASNVNFAYDFFAWSFGSRPSGPGFLPPGSWARANDQAFNNLLVPPASLFGDALAPASQTQRFFFVPSAAPGPSGVASNACYPSWTPILVATVPTAIEPNFRGRYRVFAYTRIVSASFGGQPTNLVGPQLILDAVANPGAALASNSAVSSMWAGTWIKNNPIPFQAGFQLHDLGEITLPNIGSGMMQQPVLRLWAGGVPATGQSLGSWTLDFGGLDLLSMEGPAGVMPYGLAVPSPYVTANVNNSPSQSGLMLDAVSNRAVNVVLGGVGSPAVIQDARVYYRGAMPVVGASTTRLDALVAAREIGTAVGGPNGRGGTWPVLNMTYGWAAVSVTGRPRFTFLKGL